MPLHNSDTQLDLGLAVEELCAAPLFQPYVIRDINRVSGVVKFREVHAPNDPMRAAQAVLLKDLRRHIRLKLPYATSVKGVSLLEGVARHRGNQYVVKYDLVKAYQNVQADRLKQVLLDLSPEHGESLWQRVSELSLLSPGGGLITGAATSPDLFNLYAGKLIDYQLAALFVDWGDVTYTRYLDDLTFSSAAPIGKRRRRQILQVVAAAGFEINRQKAEVVDLVEAGVVEVNGVGLTLMGQLYLPQRYRRVLYSLLKQAQYNPAVDESLVAGCMSPLVALAKLEPGLPINHQRLLQMYQAYRCTLPGYRHRMEARRIRQYKYRERRRRNGRPVRSGGRRRRRRFGR